MLFIVSKTGQKTHILEANCKRCGVNVPMEAFYLDAKRDAAPCFYHPECVAAIVAALDRGFMTNDQERRYIRGGGVRCPFCDHENLMRDGVLDADLGIITLAVTCSGCGKCWFDVYNLAATLAIPKEGK